MCNSQSGVSPICLLHFYLFPLGIQSLVMVGVWVVCNEGNESPHYIYINASIITGEDSYKRANHLKTRCKIIL